MRVAGIRSVRKCKRVYSQSKKKTTKADIYQHPGNCHDVSGQVAIIGNVRIFVANRLALFQGDRHEITSERINRNGWP